MAILRARPLCLATDRSQVVVSCPQVRQPGELVGLLARIGLSGEGQTGIEAVGNLVGVELQNAADLWDFTIMSPCLVSRTCS